MSCLYCKHYKELEKPCSKGILIKNTMEDLDCKYYHYNGELDEN